ncbi:mycorrhiza-induced NACHT/WD40-repeat domain protein, NWD [Reticulomyxa filosa]|uniref:Mycorrhiza-induced NACHT/WD40-repeat domain protein, NWD n=1 Tax=Reticulomyxa filosa TaxID=46433 RepID=X6N9P8_RETFI|nr:mycorrhiza-induced NACHT/WD40-repeat domain protein, NWD [Reticulomyxa filosa]|eukprot:ETO22761.1 mycorrhiza-induced NACHT/WD40-repeat domain protein, NWD [Reticulomyxa filosa]
MTSNECYSYHTLKNQYKYICSYPDNITLENHNVIKLVSNNPNDIILLYFGGFVNEIKHTLMMKYVSVWDEGEIELRNTKDYNKWMDFTNDSNEPICIGRESDEYRGVRVVIGGSNNHLLFIVYCPNVIDVFDLNKLQHIKRDILPIGHVWVLFHCFVSKMENRTEQMGQKKTEMLLFRCETGLSIEYDEDNNTFQFYTVRVCTTLGRLKYYSYIRVKDVILFFGGHNFTFGAANTVHKYSIRENKWMKFEHTLPIPLYGCAGLISDDDTYVHILGGKNNDNFILSTHMKTEFKAWMGKETEKEKQWIMEEDEKRELEEINSELKEMKQEISAKKLKRQIEIEHIIEHWLRLLSIKKGWIDDFTVIIRYFKPLKIFQGHSDFVDSVQFSPDCSKIVSSSKDKTIRIWNIKSGKEIRILEGHFDDVNNVKFSTKENSKDIQIMLQVLNFSPCGRNIVSGSWDGTIRFWDVNSGQEIKILEGHSSVINDVHFSPDGQTVVSSSKDQTVVIWDVKSGKKIIELENHSHNVTRAQFSSDALSVVSCSRDKTILIWNVKSGTVEQQLDGHNSAVNDVKFSPDGQTIVSCSESKTIRLWDVKFGMEIQKLQWHSNYVTGVDFSSDGNAIASCSIDKTIRLWDRL